MQMSRRKSLALIGGGAIFAAAAPVGGFLATRTPTKALEPWDRAGNYDDPRLRALSYALLAPNPHNRQPWEIELVGDDRLAIHRDKKRNLPVTDPFARQLTIGMGCFIELMEMAAASERIGVKTTLFPDGEEGPVAACTFEAGAAKPNPLFRHAIARRSHKEMFDKRLVDTQAALPLEVHADIFLKGAERDELRRIAHDAWMTEVQTPAAWKESIDLLRLGKAEINANPDGIDVGGPMIDTLVLLGLATREAALDIDNPNARAPIEDTANAILSAPAMSVIRTSGNSRSEQIEAGRRWLRLNLAATGAGLALRPVSQALQEYAEMRKLHTSIHAQFARNGETIQMLGLLGYGARTPRTPRWPLESRIRNA
ncbi:MAG: twin-arginine translocation pathway signal protein [Hyphomicrobiaceae bacterium]